eukprot:340513-Pelagomonas_calceolata.AAC.4
MVGSFTLYHSDLGPAGKKERVETPHKKSLSKCNKGFDGLTSAAHAGLGPVAMNTRIANQVSGHGTGQGGQLGCAQSAALCCVVLILALLAKER